MSVSIIIGGQYGSEGKGKAAYLWAEKMDAAAVVRVGGSNSGHTVYDENFNRYAFRMLPTASILDHTACVLPAGSYIDISVLKREIELTGITREHLKIDHNAVIIKEEYQQQECAMNLRKEIGSTGSGTGAAVMDRVRRDRNAPIQMAKDIEELSPYLCDTKYYLRQLIAQGKHVVIEGTQGYGLSNYHAKCYPYATSRDTTAAGFLAETGLSPLDVEHVVMVIRAFPIRVSGSSGPLLYEIDWDTVSRESGAEEYFTERTTVTDQVRRVARFDAGIVKDAIIANNPDIIVLNHVDYLDFDNKNSNVLSQVQKDFVAGVEADIEHDITFCGNGEMNIIPWKEG